MLCCLFCLFVVRFVLARIGSGLPISQSLADGMTASTVTMATAGTLATDETLMTVTNAKSAVTLATSSSSQTLATKEACVGARATAGCVNSPVHQEILLHRDRALKVIMIVTL